MPTLDLTACPVAPFAHQRTAITKIVEEPYVFLTDEMGLGKSKIIVDAASVLYAQGKIDHVIIVATSQVKPVWLDPELGQLATHCWPTIFNTVTHYHSRKKQWETGHSQNGEAGLLSVVTKYE